MNGIFVCRQFLPPSVGPPVAHQPQQALNSWEARLNVRIRLSAAVSVAVKMYRICQGNAATVPLNQMGVRLLHDGAERSQAGPATTLIGADRLPPSAGLRKATRTKIRGLASGSGINACLAPKRIEPCTRT